MAEAKTRPTLASPEAFVAAVEHPRRREDAEVLLRIFTEVTGEEPVLWGTSMVGFGHHHYVYESGREGDTFRVGFAPRKANLALYGLTGSERSGELLQALGKHRTGASCLYVAKLADVDVDVLRELVAAGWEASGGPCD